MKNQATKITKVAYLFCSMFLVSCSANNTKRAYLLAEQLWTDGYYEASVSEFENVIALDPNGKYGIQALYRAAMTQTVFLGQDNSAIEKLRVFVSKSRSESHTKESLLQIGNILFERLNLYDDAIEHYQLLLKKESLKKYHPLFAFRIGKAYFFLWKFQQAIDQFDGVANSYSGSDFEEKAVYEKGICYLAKGNSSSSLGSDEVESFKKAKETFEELLDRFPNGKYRVKAKFGIASAYEELDLLKDAAEKYKEIAAEYPIKEVIDVKIKRISERMSRRNQ